MSKQPATKPEKPAILRETADQKFLREKNDKERRLAVREQAVALKAAQEQRDSALLQQALDSCVPAEQMSPSACVNMLTAAYRLAVAHGEVKAAVAAVNSIAQVAGFMVSKTMVGTPDQFSRAQSRDEIREIIQQTAGERGADIFDAVLEQWQEAGIVEAEIVEEPRRISHANGADHDD